MLKAKQHCYYYKENHMAHHHTEDFANWIQSWATRFENAYNAGIDHDGWPRFKEAMQHFERTGKFTPGQLDYMLRRDAALGCGKLKQYNTHNGYNKKLGNILPAPAEAVILGGFVDWSIKYQNMPDLTKRLAAQAPGWRFNPLKATWQGDNLAPGSKLSDLFY